MLEDSKMASVLKICLWSAFFGIIGFFVHYETSTVVLHYKEEIIIKAKRTDVYATIADVERSCKFQPFVVGVTHLIKTINAADLEEMKYTLHQNLSLLDGLYSEIVDIRAITTLTETDREIRTVAHVIDDTVIVKQKWTLSDTILEDNQKGTLLVDSAEMHTPRIFSKFVKELSTASRKALLKNLKRHIEKNSPLEEI